MSKKRQEILKAWEENCRHNRKIKMEKTENEEVNKATYEFFIKCHAVDIPVTGPMLQTKAKKVAQHLHIDNFQASNGGWKLFIYSITSDLGALVVKQQWQKTGR